MLRQVADGAEKILYTHLGGRFGQFRRFQQMEQAEAKVLAFEPEPIIDRHDAISVVGQQFEPGHVIRIRALAADKTAAENKQNGRLFLPFKAQRRPIRRLINIQIQRSRILLRKKVRSLEGLGLDGKSKTEEKEGRKSEERK